jgi:hypothetical protein
VEVEAEVEEEILAMVEQVQTVPLHRSYVEMVVVLPHTRDKENIIIEIKM